MVFDRKTYIRNWMRIHSKKYRQMPKKKEYHKKYMRKYHKTPQRKAYMKKYIQTDNYKISQKKYMQSLKGKEYHKKYMKQYSKTQKFKDYMGKYRKTSKWKSYSKKYRQTPQGKIVGLRIYTRRKRDLSFVPIMNNPFPQEVKVDYHHLNDIFVIPTPRKLHQSLKGEQHRIKINRKIERLGFNLGDFTK